MSRNRDTLIFAMAFRSVVVEGSCQGASLAGGQPVLLAGTRFPSLPWIGHAAQSPREKIDLSLTD